MFDHPLVTLIHCFYQRLISFSSHLQSLLLFALRLIFGHQIIDIGLSQLIHFDMAFLGPLVARTEFGCGLLLMVGFASRLAALPLIFILLFVLHALPPDSLSLFDPMLIATSRPFPLLLSCLFIFIFGPGRISLDAWIKARLKAHL